MGWRSEFGRSTYRYKSNGISIGGGFKNLLALLSKSRESWWTGPCKKFPSLSSISCTVCELSSFHHRRHHNVQDKPGDAFSSHSRSPNRVPFHMLGMLVTFSLFFSYSTSKNVVTLKFGSEATYGHWKWYHSIDYVRFPIIVLL